MNAETAESLVTFAEEMRNALPGLDGKAVLSRLEDGRPDLLEALDWFVEHARPDDALRLASALVPFWMATKRIAEGDQWFERVLAMPGGDAARRARGLFDHGYLVFWAGEYDRSATLQEQALELGRRVTDPSVIGLALGGLARIALRTDVEAAKRLLREALAVTEGTSDRIGRSGAMHVLAVAAQMSGDFAEARRLMTERIRLARETHNYATIAIESSNLSMVERQLGNLDTAEALSREALDITNRRGDELATAWMVNGLAAVTAAKGDLERAATLVGFADVGIERAGGEWPPDERIQHDETVSVLTAKLEPAALERARALGAAMATVEGVEFALTQPRMTGATT
jgi:tetratricopeptide (TPR) repeat protein